MVSDIRVIFHSIPMPWKIAWMSETTAWDAVVFVEGNAMVGDDPRRDAVVPDKGMLWFPQGDVVVPHPVTWSPRHPRARLRAWFPDTRYP